jgi:hypothetical protein
MTDDLTQEELLDDSADPKDSLLEVPTRAPGLSAEEGSDSSEGSETSAGSSKGPVRDRDQASKSASDTRQQSQHRRPSMPRTSGQQSGRLGTAGDADNPVQKKRRKGPADDGRANEQAGEDYLDAITKDSQTPAEHYASSTRKSRSKEAIVTEYAHAILAKFNELVILYRAEQIAHYKVEEATVTTRTVWKRLGWLFPWALAAFLAVVQFVSLNEALSCTASAIIGLAAWFIASWRVGDV